MTSQLPARRFVTAATLLTLGLSSTPASAEQFVAVDVTYTHSAETTKDSHYFVKPSAATPSNWRSPVNYAGGSVYMHFEVYTKPSNEPTVWVICFIGSPSYACTDTGAHTTTGVYEKNVKLPDIWQYGQVDWSKPITQIPIILKDDANVKVAPENVGAARSALFMPTKLRAVITIVSAGGTYVPPVSGGVGDGGGAGDSDGVGDSGGDGGADGDQLPDPNMITATDPATDSASDTATEPAAPSSGSTGSTAGRAPAATMTPAEDSDSVGCTCRFGRRGPSSGFGWLGLLVLALRRKARPFIALPRAS
jgi:hypothetical protein